VRRNLSLNAMAGLGRLVCLSVSQPAFRNLKRGQSSFQILATSRCRTKILKGVILKGVSHLSRFGLASEQRRRRLDGPALGDRIVFVNILFVGNNRGTSTSQYYYSSLLKLGHSVVAWNPEYFASRGALDRIVQKLNQGPSPWKVQKINEELIRICRQNFFDLVFVMSENFITREAIEEIREETLTAPRFLFHSHDNLFFDRIIKPPGFYQSLAAFDIAFTTKSQNVERYMNVGQKNAFYVPSAYEPMVHRPISREQSRLNRDFDVSFVGTYDASRIRWLEQAGWHRLHVWGDFWQRFPDFQTHRTHIDPHAIYYFEFADVCSRSKCSLGLLREEAEDRHTQRTFEIPACGSLQFAPRNEEIQGFFKEDHEIVLFDTPEELKDKLDYYLAHDTERARLAEAGYKRVLQENHTYTDRVKTMLEKVAAL
jgi:spore maturation protein CgeB